MLGFSPNGLRVFILLYACYELKLFPSVFSQRTLTLIASPELKNFEVCLFL